MCTRAAYALCRYCDRRARPAHDIREQRPSAPHSEGVRPSATRRPATSCGVDEPPRTFYLFRREPRRLAPGAPREVDVVVVRFIYNLATSIASVARWSREQSRIPLVSRPLTPDGDSPRRADRCARHAATDRQYRYRLSDREYTDERMNRTCRRDAPRAPPRGIIPYLAPAPQREDRGRHIAGSAATQHAPCFPHSARQAILHS